MIIYIGENIGNIWQLKSSQYETMKKLTQGFFLVGMSNEIAVIVEIILLDWLQTFPKGKNIFSQTVVHNVGLLINKTLFIWKS